jgi:hypothetical protein
MATAHTTQEIDALRKAELLAHFCADPLFLELLAYASETVESFTTFINT